MSFDDLFDASYKRVLEAHPEGLEFFEAFYQRFLKSSEQVRVHFRDTDMERQRRMLRKSFYSLIAFYASSSADDVLCKIASTHSARELDIKPALYDLWLESLIDTVRDFDPDCRDPACSDDIELAWRLVMSPGITYMKFKHSHC